MMFFQPKCTFQWRYKANCFPSCKSYLSLIFHKQVFQDHIFFQRFGHMRTQCPSWFHMRERKPEWWHKLWCRHYLFHHFHLLDNYFFFFLLEDHADIDVTYEFSQLVTFTFSASTPSNLFRAGDCIEGISGLGGCSTGDRLSIWII